MVAFNTIKEGDTLWSVQRQKMGNTMMSRAAVFPVCVESVDHESKTAMCRWNGNKATLYTERRIAKLRRSKPIKKEE